MSRTLPKEVSEAIDAHQNATHDWETAPKRGDTARAQAAVDLGAARLALESAILAYGDAAREGALREAAGLPPEIVELLRDVASGPCTPDLRGRAGAALVRRDLVGSCSRCGGSGYERIGDGSVNAWGACEVCRPGYSCTLYRPPTTFVDSGTGQAVTVEHPTRVVTVRVPPAPAPAGSAQENNHG